MISIRSSLSRLYFSQRPSEKSAFVCSIFQLLLLHAAESRCAPAISAAKTRRTGALTNGRLDEDGFGLVGVDAVSRSADGLGPEDVLLPGLQSVDGESDRANKRFKSALSLWQP